MSNVQHRYAPVRMSYAGIRRPHTFSFRDGVWMLYEAFDNETPRGVSVHADIIEAVRALRHSDRIAFVPYGMELPEAIAVWEQGIKDEKILKENGGPTENWDCRSCGHKHVKYSKKTERNNTAGLCVRDIHVNADCGCDQRQPW